MERSEGFARPAQRKAVKMSIEYLETDFDKASYLCELLKARATGQGASPDEYIEVRKELLANKDVSKILPRWLRVCGTLASFWGFIQPKFETYSERRIFLDDEFYPIFELLEFGNNTELLTEHRLPPERVTMTPSSQSIKKRKVFIVHGRDNEAKYEVARFIDILNIEAIILHEKASSGMTIIEKIEHYSTEVDFAIVLYTPCDHGRGAWEKKVPARNRARQNVVFEHGYLMAKLGRKNVCALVKGKIVIPNDISGVVYTNLDPHGAWQIEVRKELRACGYELHEQQH